MAVMRSCGVACAPAHAVGRCVLGVCTVDACLSGMADCNGSVADGCEVDLLADEEHCGGCGTSCAPENADFHCELGICQLDACGAGYADCNGEVADGCEVELATSPVHCGGCGLFCDPPNAWGVCVDGACDISSCGAGYADCNGDVADGCEVELATSLQHCGGCGAVCAPANGAGGCIEGVCTLLSCDGGFADCDGSGGGCDTDLVNDGDHCGACGFACADHAGVYAESAGCISGRCVFRCVPGRTDLNGDLQAGDAGDGCESDCTPSGPDDDCDGIDDDCNGVADDGYVPVVCGVGACLTASRCDQGAESCTPLPPGVEGPGACADLVDNDCDGLVDLADPDCAAVGCVLDPDCDDQDDCTADRCGGDGRCVNEPIAGCGEDAFVPDADTVEPDVDGDLPPRPQAKSDCQCSAAKTAPSPPHLGWMIGFLLLLGRVARRRSR